jgi:hypothetical protein
MKRKFSPTDEEAEKVKKQKIDDDTEILEKMKEKVFTHMELDIPYNFQIFNSHLSSHLENEFNKNSDFKSKVTKKFHSTRINFTLCCSWLKFVMT